MMQIKCSKEDIAMSKRLVAYFSASRTKKKTAKLVAETKNTESVSYEKNRWKKR